MDEGVSYLLPLIITRHLSVTFKAISRISFKELQRYLIESYSFSISQERYFNFMINTKNLELYLKKRYRVKHDSNAEKHDKKP